MKKIKPRADQKKAVQSCLTHNLGQIIRPTGSGKSLIAQEVIRLLIKQNSNAPFIAAVGSPRIILAKQWIQTTGRYLIQQHKLPIGFINVNSGGLSSVIKDEIEKALFDLGMSSVPIVSTTNTTELKNEIDNLTRKGYKIVILYTYHSSDVLVRYQELPDAIPFSVVFNDEAHFLPNNPDFLAAAQAIETDKKFFLTATPRTTDAKILDGNGMNNESIYGPIIDDVKPIEMIEKGIIVAPKLHVIGCVGMVEDLNINQQTVVDNKDYSRIVELIFGAHQFHKNQVESNSADNTKIGAKLLVVCNGQMTLEGIFENKVFKQKQQENPQIKMFGLSSNFGVYFNGIHNDPPVTIVRKEEFLSALYKMGDDDDCMVFHVDMIAEGLDVPGMTGLLPLRNLGKIKFLQNLGRTTRTHQVDRDKIESGELKPLDLVGRIKPNCYVILPYCIENGEDFLERNVTIIDGLRSDYGFDPSENVVVDLLNPAQVPPELNEYDLKRQIRGKVADDVATFYHQIEDEAVECEEILLTARFRGCLEDGLGIIDAMA